LKSLKRYKKSLKAGFFACLLFIHNALSYDLETLSHNPKWLKLLHFKNGKSEIDDPKFFLSKEGKTNPYKELVATIQAFLESKERGDNHPICKFPARFQFLDSLLKLKSKLSFFPECKELNKFLREINPQKISIIFSDYYINSPASMYGHTFLRIDPPFKSPLLGYAVNYAANADAKEGLMYYIKGLTGGYKGFYSIFPYYKKIFEYANLESRNLWEYSLNLKPEEVRFITLHIWEIKDHYSYYYFFDKNCSYQILYLIDIVHPEYNLTEHFNLWTIPVDTIRVLKEKGLIINLHFRPSATTLISEFIKGNPDINKNDISMAQKIARFEINIKNFLKEKSISTVKKAKILELSKNLFLYFSIKEKLPQKVYKKRLLKLLSARSKIPVKIPIKVKKPYPPEYGHKPAKISFEAGSENGKKFISTTVRTAYHQLEDRDTGFLKGSEIMFPAMTLKNFPDRNKTVIDNITFIKIISISPRNIIFKPTSWLVNFSYQRDWINKQKKPFINFETGFGLGYESHFLYYIGISSGAQINLYNSKNSRLISGIKFISIYSGRKIKHIFSIYPGLLFYTNNITKSVKFNYKSSFFISQNTSVTASLNYVILGGRNFYQFAFSTNRFF